MSQEISPSILRDRILVRSQKVGEYFARAKKAIELAKLHEEPFSSDEDLSATTNGLTLPESLTTPLV